jgi:hypothetical protein
MAGHRALLGATPMPSKERLVAVDPPRKLVHTWIAVGEPVGVMTCLITATGWETSFYRLSEILASENK